MRLNSPDGACVGVDVPVGNARSYEGTIVEVTDPSHIKALRKIGYTTTSAAGVSRSAARVCRACGFHAFFTTCGRCGGECGPAGES